MLTESFSGDELHRDGGQGQGSNQQRTVRHAAVEIFILLTNSPLAGELPPP